LENLPIFDEVKA